MPDFTLEMELGGIVCGIDEAGRGPWAGPVVASAVILTPDALPDGLAEAIDDSKRLTARRREAVYAELEGCVNAGSAVIGVGEASVEEIDTHNILQATFMAMSRAVAALGRAPDHALVDGNGRPALACPVRAIPGGDGLSLSIAAASIVAKVTRDRTMSTLDAAFPGYGFARHMGYGTRAHAAALEALGITPHHRKSFRPITRYCVVDKSDSRI